MGPRRGALASGGVGQPASLRQPDWHVVSEYTDPSRRVVNVCFETGCSLSPSLGRECPPDHVCLPGLGDNPNFGYTNFDTFPWSMLTTFQLITLDYWENIYNMVSLITRSSIP